MVKVYQHLKIIFVSIIRVDKWDKAFVSVYLNSDHSVSCGPHYTGIIPANTLSQLVCTRWFKYDRDYLYVNKSQFVPVIFEPPCIMQSMDRSFQTIKEFWPHLCERTVPVT